MRSGWLGGFGAAGGMLLLVAAAILVQPNVRVLDEVGAAWSGLWDGQDDRAAPAVAVDQLKLSGDRVSGRVRNLAEVPIRRALLQIRVSSPEGDRIHEATVYNLAAGAEAWFGIPLLAGSRAERVAFVEAFVEADASSASDRRDAPATTLPSQRRRSGVGGMQDVERYEQEVQRMEDAVRSVTPETGL